MKTPGDVERNAVVTVGDGRGFVVEGGWRGRLVVTAAHCLPAFPPCDTWSSSEERTYKLLAPIGLPATIAAECIYVDPVADVAVLAKPDYELYDDDAEAYTELVDGASALALSDIPASDLGATEPDRRAVWMVTLAGDWFSARAYHEGGGLWLIQTGAQIRGGMSGSPILSEDGRAIGVVVNSATSVDGEPVENAFHESGQSPAVGQPAFGIARAHGSAAGVGGCRASWRCGALHQDDSDDRADRRALAGGRGVSRQR